MPESTKRDIKRTFQNRANTINNKYGTDMKWNDLAGFFESKLWEKMAKEYGSKTTMKAIGEIQKNEKDIKKALKRDELPALHIRDDKVSAAVNSILEEQGLSILKMVK